MILYLIFGLAFKSYIFKGSILCPLLQQILIYDCISFIIFIIKLLFSIANNLFALISDDSGISFLFAITSPTILAKSLTLSASNTLSAKSSIFFAVALSLKKPLTPDATLPTPCLVGRALLAAAFTLSFPLFLCPCCCFCASSADCVFLPCFTAFSNFFCSAFKLMNSVNGSAEAIYIIY